MEPACTCIYIVKNGRQNFNFMNIQIFIFVQKFLRPISPIIWPIFQNPVNSSSAASALKQSNPGANHISTISIFPSLPPKTVYVARFGCRSIPQKKKKSLLGLIMGDLAENRDLCQFQEFQKFQTYLANLSRSNLSTTYFDL